MFSELNSFFVKLKSTKQILNKKCSKQQTLLTSLSTLSNDPTIQKIPGIFCEVGYMLATHHLEYRNTEKCRETLQKLKFETEKFKKYKLKKKVYLKLAETCNRMGKYTLALTYAQRSLELAWDQEDVKSEMLAMDMMGRCYFNLEQLEMAWYFHRRSMIGEQESKESELRKASLISLQKRRAKFELIFHKNYYKKKAYVPPDELDFVNEKRIYLSSDEDEQLAFKFIAEQNIKTKFIEKEMALKNEMKRDGDEEGDGEGGEQARKVLGIGSKEVDFGGGGKGGRRKGGLINSLGCLQTHKSPNRNVDSFLILNPKINLTLVKEDGLRDKGYMLEGAVITRLIQNGLEFVKFLKRVCHDLQIFARIAQVILNVHAKKGFDE